jgi:hypothetical protein
MCPVSIPGPRGRGAGVQNAGDEAPVGRYLRTGGVWLVAVRVFPWFVTHQHREVGRGTFRFCGIPGISVQSMVNHHDYLDELLQKVGCTGSWREPV